MSPSSKAWASVAGVIVILVGLWALIHGSTSPAPVSAPVAGNYAAHVENAPWGFAGGLYIGNQKSVSSGDMIQLGAGQNQGTWKNGSSINAYVSLGSVRIDGVASTSIAVSVGTTTCTAVTDTFVKTAAPMWSQFIDAFNVSTGTPAGVIADNAAHKTSYPGTITVGAGKCLAVVVESSCVTNGDCGATATSSSAWRGWSNLYFPFSYTLAP